MKKHVQLAGAVLALLCIPWIAMQFSSEVNWSLFDFIVAFVLLYGLGLAIIAVFKRTQEGIGRMLGVVAILLFFMLIWAELAVGIFGTPFAGS